jgi:hypothetical protein
MNLDQIRNPHLIYPGQVLVLVSGTAPVPWRSLADEPGHGQAVAPVRSNSGQTAMRSAVPLHLIGPFLNDAVVLESNELDRAPRIVAAQEGRVLLGRGDTVYVRGELAAQRSWRLFRQPKALKDPGSGEVLGYEAAFVGTAEFLRPAGQEPGPEGSRTEVPASFTLQSLRQEAGIGDRLAPMPHRANRTLCPHAPSQPVDGRVVSIYGDGCRPARTSRLDQPRAPRRHRTRPCAGAVACR